MALVIVILSNVFCWCFFVWIKSVSHICGGRLWWVLNVLCKGCTSAASLTDGLDMILMAGSNVRESLSQSILTRYESTHFSQNCIFFQPSHFLCGHHWTLFLNKISLEGPHQVSSKVSLGLCCWQMNETWKTTLDVSKDSEYYIFAIWLAICLIAKSLFLNLKSGVRLKGKETTN